jgi:glycerol-3-phosphate dehydrogenase (NAD(P)+)
MAMVAARRGHDVCLWGTWLDDALLAPVFRGEPHPRLRMKLDGIACFTAADLARALQGAELVVHAANSDGIVPVLRGAAPHLPDVPILSVTKGLAPSKAGRMETLDVAVAEAIGRPLRFVVAAGPAKAIEIARRVLTWMVFAGPPTDANLCAEAFAGDGLYVEASDDRDGAAICSALKNAYATGLGIWDGMVGADCHNARAACFTQAVRELAALVHAAGGRVETVHGAAGVGDLHVTAAAGRNRAFGECIGKGTPAAEVARTMAAAGELTEGYAAIRTAWRFAQERGPLHVPLLAALHAVVWGGAEVRATMGALRLG